MEGFDNLKYDANGLIPAIIQDADTGEVLMMAYMNKQSLADSVRLGKTHFWSRSRQKYWMKGETSGNFLKVKSIYKDCDNDTILVLADPVGPVCHLNTRTCFVTEEGGMRGLDSDDTSN